MVSHKDKRVGKHPEMNKRKSAMMQIDYRRSLIRWTVNEGDVLRQRKETQLENLYRDACLGWKGFYGDSEFNRLGNPPARNGYQTICAPEDLDVLVKALLGFPPPMGYKQGNNNKILNDSWTVNLRSTREESENVMMDAYLKGSTSQFKEIQKAWENMKMFGIDISEELKELLRVYTDAEQHLINKEKSALEAMTYNMKKYLEAQEQRQKLTDKITALNKKINADNHPKEDEEE
jgi:hypothetical protein